MQDLSRKRAMWAQARNNAEAAQRRFKLLQVDINNAEFGLREAERDVAEAENMGYSPMYKEKKQRKLQALQNIQKKRLQLGEEMQIEIEEYLAQAAALHTLILEIEKDRLERGIR